MILVYICTAFASETVYISATGSACHVIINPTTATNNDCQMHLALRKELAWVLGGVLFAIFAFTVVLILKLRRQISGIFAEASSIVGVASLSHKLLKRGLINSYGAASHTAFKGHESPGSLDPSLASATNVFSEQRIPVKESKSKKGQISVHIASLTLFWLYLIAVLIMILYYRFVSKPGTNNRFEDFMDSQSFGVHLFMTCVGLCIKLYWGSIEKHLRSNAPYVEMASQGGATADNSVLIKTPSHLIIGLFYYSTWRQPFFGLVTLSAVLSEVLVITLTAVPFSTSTAYLTFELSVYISIGIIGVMIITILLVFIWQVRVKRKWRAGAPERIAEVLAMLDDDVRSRFGDLGELEGSQRSELVRSWGYRYVLAEGK
ncbi:hypothetical protein K491DRAFT_694487 [Lophiostoma macrostomum CBS 122681]|uniref:Uncharacterized protein n=1 Tax=Lophiostoma macrostomum CBS 122681 TaxID=1314788 RepID=A0A6A6T103_9PLEO|nr:hypothetical protein K491DRAFT_694487 [Lophiostoma macrostomum CBS 122681]